MFLGFEATGFYGIGEAPQDRLFLLGDAILTVDWEIRIYAATHEYISRTADSPSDRPFFGTLEKAFRFDRSIIGSDRIGEEITIGYGEVRLNNSEGDYDFLAIDHTPLGQRIHIKFGDRRLPYSTWRTLLDGFMVEQQVDQEGLVFKLRDAGHQLDVPSSPNVYLGTADIYTATNLTEGGADLGGKRKPKCYGWVLNVSPPLVIPSYLSYQLNDGPIQSVSAVYVRGVEQLFAGDFATVALMNAAPIYIGQYVTCLDEGFMRISAAAEDEVGQVTADFAGDKTDLIFVETTADIVRRILSIATTVVDPDDLVTSTFDDLNERQPAPVGYVVPYNSEETAAESISRLMAGIGGWCGSRRDGKFEVRRFESPSDIGLISIPAHVHLKFNGTDGDTLITDSHETGAGHTWTAFGNAQIDTADSIEGTGSLLLDGTGDYVSTPDHPDFSFGTGDLTVDFWFNTLNTTGQVGHICGQGDAAASASSTSLRITRTAANVIAATVCDGAVSTTITGSSIVTNLINTGWHHVALVRTGNVLKLFFDGVSQGGNVAFSGSPNDSVEDFAVGRAGALNADYFNGHIDRFRITKGVARWVSIFDHEVETDTVLSDLDRPAGFYTRLNVQQDVSVIDLPDAISPPPWRVLVGYARNHTVQTSDLAGSVTDERRAFLEEELRYIAIEDNAIRLDFPPGHDLTEDDTFFRDEADAAVEALRYLELFSTAGRALYKFKLCEPLFIHELGQIVFLEFPRFDLTDGKLLRIVKLIEDDTDGVEIWAYG